MTRAQEQATTARVPDIRRAPATATGGTRPSLAKTDPDTACQPQRRPFTTMGGSLFDLDATPTTISPRTTLQPVRAATSSQALSLSPGEFDVRKFVSDQKSSEPLHKSALFRASPLVDDEFASSRRPVSLKKRLPRMESSVRIAANQPTITNAPLVGAAAAAVDDTVSHFYTLEKMAESCFHAVQSRQNKTWQFLPGAEERSKSCSGVSANASSGGANSLTNVERPSRRVDVLDLDKCFETAMQFVQAKTCSSSGTDNGGAASIHASGWSQQEMATLDRDVMTIQAKVARRYTAGTTGSTTSAHAPQKRIGDAEGITDGGGGGETTNDRDPRAETLLSDDQASLARTLFEQKWSDVVLGEIQAMLTTSFLEQGALVRKTRMRYGKSFFTLERLYHKRSTELAQALEALEATRQELRLVNETHAQHTQQMKAQYEAEILRLGVGFESKRDEMERKATEANEQMAKMGDTMKTLNTIFRQMREDTEKVKAVELRENYIKLEKKYEACKEELERLRPLVQINQQLLDEKDAIVVETESLRDKIADFDMVLSSKDDAIANLMEQQSELIAAQELRAVQEDELRRLEESKAAEDDEDDDQGEYSGSGGGAGQSGDPEGGAPKLQGKRRRGGSAAVCVRCKESLRTMSQDGTLATSSASSGLAPSDSDWVKDSTSGYGGGGGGMLDARKKRIQCLYFRILLPNLRGRRPQRELAWTLSCMRSILFAKQLDDMMCRRSGGAFPLRTRMPEFVYAWFSPWKSLRDQKSIQDAGGGESGDLYAEEDELAGENTNGSDTRAAMAAGKERRSDEQRQLQADEDRWCLYYGVKALVQEGYLEAKLFLSLLDEKYGEDEQVFMLYCYRVLDVLMGGKLHWGPLRDQVSYETFSAQYDTQFSSSVRHGASSSDLAKNINVETTTAASPRVPKTIWISPFHASLATSIVLSKATEAERTAHDKKLLEFAVTNLSAQERPAVYLTPANAAIPGYHAQYMDDEKAAKPRRSRQGRGDRGTGDADADGDGQAKDEDDGDASKPLQFVDAHLWVELMMMEYKEEQAHRRAAIRLMFQTATSVSSSLPGSYAGRSGAGGRSGSVSAAAMDMEQFRIMISTLNDEIPSFVVATLFRAAFTRGNGAVNFDSFLEAAESAQFFSSCMRLENPAASIARLAGDHPSATSSGSRRGGDYHSRGPVHAAVSTSARAAFVVDKYFTLLHKDIQILTAAQPIWTRSLADSLSFELASALLDEHGGGGGMSSAIAEGVQLLTTFHRLLDALLLAGLVKKDATGGVLSSKRIFCFEKALQALLDCVREGDKTAIEQLMDTVQQKLSVKRVQILFRKHLQLNDGAPLVMRPLFHATYATHRCTDRLRKAERPLKWLQFVIADVLRRALRYDNVQLLLTELSGVSSVLRQCSLNMGSRPRTVNGGIGPAPKPLLVELLYDAFVERYGTRWEAERLLHDVFVNCRALLRGDSSDTTSGTSTSTTSSLVVLFSYLCCMGDASPDDRLMAQNEALAFLLGILRCGLHEFHVINPPSAVPQASHMDGHATSLPLHEEPQPPTGTHGDHSDLISVRVAEEILSAAFAKRATDQQQRLKARLEEHATVWKTPGLTTVPAAMLRGSFVAARGGGAAAALLPQQFIAADAFLVLAMNEWKRYIQHRMDELRVVCCSMEDEIAQFGESLPLDTIATMLQKTNVSFSNDELCVVFRRMCLTEPRASSAGSSSTSSSSTTTTPHPKTGQSETRSMSSQELLRPVDHLSDRLAAACFPLLARETLVELRRLEHASLVPFKLHPPVEEKTRFLIESWRAYDEPIRALLDELRRLGKNNDIQADALSRRAPLNGERAVHHQVLYLSSSVASDKLSSQDVAQLEALHKLFLERLDRLHEELTTAQAATTTGTPTLASPPPLTKKATAANRRASIKLMAELTESRRISAGPSSGALVVVESDARDVAQNARVLLVNETWKMFRQLLVSFARLRALAGLGHGPLPDKWDVAAVTGDPAAPVATA